MHDHLRAIENDRVGGMGRSSMCDLILLHSMKLFFFLVIFSKITIAAYGKIPQRIKIKIVLG